MKKPLKPLKVPPSQRIAEADIKEMIRQEKILLKEMGEAVRKEMNT